LTSTFLWLTAYWRGGLGKLETIVLPFGTISLFTSSVRDTLSVIYNVVVIVLVVLGFLGLVVRLFGGPATARASLEDFEDGLHPAGPAGDNAAAIFAAYSHASPFHAAQLLSPQPSGDRGGGGGGGHVPTLEGLRLWLQSPTHFAPVAPVPAA